MRRLDGITDSMDMSLSKLEERVWRRQWHPTPVLLGFSRPGKSHGRKSLVGCSPWGYWGSDSTEWLHFHFLLSCIGEGNGNPLQCSCLENPRDRGAWWAAAYGVTQSRTRLKWLSSSSIIWRIKHDFEHVTKAKNQRNKVTWPSTEEYIETKVMKQILNLGLLNAGLNSIPPKSVSAQTSECDSIWK